MTSSASDDHTSNAAAAVLAAVILLAAGAFMIVWGGSQSARSDASADWPVVTGTVLDSRVDVVPGSPDLPSDSHQPAVSYAYEVDGQAYRGDRVTFGLHDSRDRDAVEATVARYPAGGDVQIAYDPGDPSESVLEAGEAGNNRRFQLMGAALVVSGLGLLALPVVLARRGQASDDR